MAINAGALEALEPFLDEGLISEVLYEVRSGKEATVYCCRAITGPLLAAKVYRALESRRFKNDAIYQAGRMHLAREGRAKRAAQNKSSFGRKVQYATWLDQEWQVMNLLHDAGCDIPRPVARAEQAILMSYAGDETTAAPNLIEADLDPSSVSTIAASLMSNIERMLDLHVVHGDLSPYNVLHWRSRATIIDFPQAIDPRLNPAALPLLTRDIQNICTWAAKRGVKLDAHAITADLWRRFVLGEIG